MRRSADLNIVDSDIQYEGACTIDGNLACHSAIVVINSNACDILTVNGLPISGIRDPDLGWPVCVADVISHDGDVKLVIFKGLRVYVAIYVNKCNLEEIGDSCAQLINVL